MPLLVPLLLLPLLLLLPDQVAWAGPSVLVLRSVWSVISMFSVVRGVLVGCKIGLSWARHPTLAVARLLR